MIDCCRSPWVHIPAFILSVFIAFACGGVLSYILFGGGVVDPAAQYGYGIAASLGLLVPFVWGILMIVGSGREDPDYE